MLIYIILCILVVVIAVIVGIFVSIKNKFQTVVIKINEAEEDVGTLLKDKYNLIVEIGQIVKEKTKENVFEELENVNLEETNSFKLNGLLTKYNNSIVELSEFNKDIEFDEKDLEVFDRLNKVSVDSLAVMKYYNDNVAIYNDLINKFPSSIVAKIKGYKEKEIYTNEKEEIFEILKK